MTSQLQSPLVPGVNEYISPQHPTHYFPGYGQYQPTQQWAYGQVGHVLPQVYAAPAVGYYPVQQDLSTQVHLSQHLTSAHQVNYQPTCQFANGLVLSQAQPAPTIQQGQLTQVHFHQNLAAAHRDNEQPKPDTDLLNGGNLSKQNKSTFPTKLHHIISDPANSHIIFWMVRQRDVVDVPLEECRSYLTHSSTKPHGRAFKVLQREELLRDVLPRYFVCTKYETFTRTLDKWGFRRMTTELGTSLTLHSFAHGTLYCLLIFVA